MRSSNSILTDILDAKEKRTLLRSSFSGFTTLSLSLNIAGVPKSNDYLTLFFNLILRELRNFLMANRIKIITDEEIIQTDAAGDFYLVPLANTQFNIQKIKLITENFEEQHCLGRLIDVDIFDVNCKPISSKKQKVCYLCGKHSAISCMRNKRHTYTEIREKIAKDVKKYNFNNKKNEVVNKLSSMAIKAVLYEIALHPKPGLVSFDNCGSHDDMNFFTFLDSSSVLFPYFKDFCNLGYNYNDNKSNVLAKIREIGLLAEEAMFDATNSVNTHKGVIFLMGICLFSLAKILSKDKIVSEVRFREIVRAIGNDIVKNELGANNNTHGEIVFNKYGKIGAGVRGEVEAGLPTVFDTALPYFKKTLNSSSIVNQKHIQTILMGGLLRIMEKNNDSNILYRSDKKTLVELQRLSKCAINNFDEYNKLDEFCRVKNISPGGSADLLAVSLLLHNVNIITNDI